MAASLQVGVIRAALKTALGNRANLSGVALNSFEPGEDDKQPEHIWFGDPQDGRLEPIARLTRTDHFVLPVTAYVIKAGDGDTVAAAAEDRCLALMAEVEAETQTNTTLTSTARYAFAEQYEIRNGANPGNRWCETTMLLIVDTELVTAG